MQTKEIEDYSPLETIFRFCETFGKITKHLGFHVIVKTVDLQDTNYTTLTNDIKVTIVDLYVIVPLFLPNAEQ